MDRFAGLFRKKKVSGLPHRHDMAPNFTPPPQEPASPLLLDIVVGGRCPVCRSSLGTLEALRRELPRVRVRIIDLDAPGTETPQNIVAIPSILLNGHLVATGNPALAELKRFILSLSD